MFEAIHSDHAGQSVCVMVRGPRIAVDTISDHHGASLTMWDAAEAERIAAALLQAVAAVRGTKEAV